MSARTPIVLIGFMGVGKSSVAEALERLYSCEIVEADDLLVKQSRYDSIPAIFENEGEDWFREREHEVLRELLSGSVEVISTGGGVIESKRNRRLLEDSGATIVHLSATFEMICSRIEDPSSRPLFRDREAARKRFERREPLYRAIADFRVPTEDRTPEDLAKLVAQLCDVSVDGDVSRKLEVCAVIGDPVEQSQSPAIHSKAMAIQDRLHDRTFVACKVSAESLTVFMERFRSNDYWRGLAVTIPHKVAIVAMCDRIDDTAEKIGAVNTVVKRDGASVGFNTDWQGILRPVQKRIACEGVKALVLGAGGTARAAIFALCSSGAEVAVANRTGEKAAKLAEEFGVSWVPLEDLKDIKSYQIVIQTTSVGMGSDDTLFNKDQFLEGQVIVDAVYHPEWTRFLLEGKAAGAVPICGKEMFVAQAEAQYELHWGEMPPEGVMAEVLR